MLTNVKRRRGRAYRFQDYRTRRLSQKAKTGAKTVVHMNGSNGDMTRYAIDLMAYRAEVQVLGSCQGNGNLRRIYHPEAPASPVHWR